MDPESSPHWLQGLNENVNYSHLEKLGLLEFQQAQLKMSYASLELAMTSLKTMVDTVDAIDIRMIKNEVLWLRNEVKRLNEHLEECRTKI